MSLNSVMNFRTLNGSKLEREREREQEEGGWKRNLFNCKCYAIKAKNPIPEKIAYSISKTLWNSKRFR
ncbi:uncharacterized protein LOC132783615 isoform X2 [Drosophila nasuta]|uniref:uncharacterized protein LOC132783615 isoform X2 n=1 Tax=Drosophila nasuta TaxID=42062 RepID=UPI00295F2839|nr:uncharacterized protein LOC132783615 isoform X2 [Drosophila nasuta]